MRVEADDLLDSRLFSLATVPHPGMQSIQDRPLASKEAARFDPKTATYFRIQFCKEVSFKMIVERPIFQV